MDQTGTLTTGARRFRTRRRRFLLVATAALAAVATAMGISFTADTGTSTVSVAAGSSSSLVFPVAASRSLPTDDPAGHTIDWGDASTDTSALAFGTKAHNTTIGDGTATHEIVLPSWTPVAGAAGSVTIPGDLFVVDGRTSSAGGANHITVNIYATNLADMQKSYSSFAWPVDLYFEDASTVVTNNVTIKGGIGDGTNGGSGGWKSVAPLSPSGVTFTAANFFLTNTGGFLSYYLPTGTDRFYEFALDQAGSFYTVNTTVTCGSPATTAKCLSPQFFVTAQAT